jgi:flagellar hook-basal body complex protein FliE
MNSMELKPVTGGTPISGIQKTAKTDPSGFGDLLKQSIASVDKTIKESGAMSTGIVAGQHSNIHETMIAMEKSSIAFRMLTKVQAKVLDAYQEVMRIQL